MARKPVTASSSSPARKRAKRARSKIPEPFQTIPHATVTAGPKKVKVPMLVLYGEWLAAVGFPIGSAAYLTTDKRCELALHRLGLGLSRRLYVRAARWAEAAEGRTCSSVVG
jgi:hypothetical protein